jgi:hypothetical protein
MKLQLRTNTALAIAASFALFTGCSKPANEPSAPTPSAPASSSTTKLPEPTTLPKVPSGHPQIGLPPATEKVPVVSLSQIEDQYRAATSLKEKIKTIRLLVNVRDEGTAVALGRMFHAEKDPELREEILETLIDIKGSEADKLSVLASAVASSQPPEIREVAIDIMIDLGSRNAIPVLQNLVNDPDTKIRDAAKDAIRQIQNPIPPSTSKMDENDVDEE